MCHYLLTFLSSLLSHFVLLFCAEPIKRWTFLVEGRAGKLTETINCPCWAQHTGNFIWYYLQHFEQIALCLNIIFAPGSVFPLTMPLRPLVSELALHIRFSLFDVPRVCRQF